jgi:uncharacterized protein involved in tellurium resistance
MIADPSSAPARPDLSFLRRRTARTAAAPAPVASGPSRRGVDYVHHGGSPVPSEPVPDPLDLADRDPLELSGRDPLELSGRDPLELSGRDPLELPERDRPVPRPGSGVAAVAPPAFEVARVRAGTPVVLSPGAPTVTLTRLQSGIGTLTVEAACSPVVGDLRLGCAWELRSGLSSVVQASTGVRTAPPRANRPVIVGDRSDFERLRIDLRQARELNRLIVYAFSESGATLNWGGTLVVTTFGGARIELPLDRPPAASVQVLLSIYPVDGEFVLRAEMEQFAGPSIRPAVDAYDFYRVAWLDPRTPLV